MALPSSAHLLFFLLLLFHLHMIASSAQLNFSFPIFLQENSSLLSFSTSSSGIQAGALQVTFDSGSRSLDVVNTSGQITYKGSKLHLWDPAYNYSASFNTSFLLNMGPIGDGGSNLSGGGGMAFFLTPVIATQIPASFGPFLGLHNSSSSPDHRFFAVEFDTFQDSFQLDPDNNHVGIDINTTRSLFTQPLQPHNITLNANVTDAGTNTSVWIDYDGYAHQLDVYLANNGAQGLGTKPSSPVISRYQLDLRQYLPQDVYVGFSASSGSVKETHCVLIWSFSSVGFPIDRASSKLAIALGVGLSVCALLFIAVLIPLILLFRSRRREALLQDMAADYGPRRFKFKDLKKATKGFSDECKLGQGGFGAVYRGTLNSREGSIEVAVKRLSQNSSQGKKEFMMEIDSIGKMRHRNLVRLLGWSFDGWSTGRLMLVYEYMPNGSLDRWIHPPSQDMATMKMDWNTRMHILKGVAAGLLYLHEEWEMVVVHRDLKPSNIMLDSDFNARLGDFGLARFIKNKVAGSEGSDQQQQDNTQTMTIAGTPGYIAPECMTGTITKESDVYSFGAVAMELATGKRSSVENLLWLWKLYENGQLQSAAKMDNGLENYDKNEMELVLRLIISCCQPQPASRPSMRQIVHLLNSSSSSSAVTDFSSSFPVDAPAASFLPGITLDSLLSLASSPSQHLLSSSITSCC